MVAANYPACYKRIQAHEGGNDDDPIDPGGRTSRGVLQREYDAYRSRKNLPHRDVWLATDSEIAEIMKSGYWDKMRCDELPSGVDYSVDDYGVNSGIGRSGKVLRRVLGLNADDWHVTDEVIAEVKKRDPSAVVIAINQERLRFLQSLKTWDHFGGGWGRRVSEVKAFSLQLASGAIAPVPPPKLPAKGKGQHLEPNHDAVIAGGSVAVALAVSLTHWLGEHPTITAIVLGLGFIILALIVLRLKSNHVLRQETPMPGTPVVPTIVSVDAVRAASVQASIQQIKP